MSLYVKIKKDFGNFKLDTEFEMQGKVLGLLGASGCGESQQGNRHDCGYQGPGDALGHVS